MKRFKLVTHMALQAILIASLLVMPLGITGCSSQQVQDTLSVAAQVATSAAAIISPVSPEYGALIGAVGSDLKDVSNLYAAYVAAAAADKPSIAGKLHAVLDTITANLGTILRDAGVKAPGLITEVQVAVAVINSAVTLILAHLPSSSPSPTASASQARAQSQSASLPVVKNAKSASDLANEWNSKVGVAHPGAVVDAPKHPKKLGIF